ncbi:MAG: alpha/beta hydrolase [Kiloniellales bacterium]
MATVTDFYDFVVQLDGLCRDLGLDRVTLIGFSMGALVAQAYALAQPERAARLVVLSGVYGRDPAARAGRLGAIACATLVMTGELDPGSTPEMAQAWPRRSRRRGSKSCPAPATRCRSRRRRRSAPPCFASSMARTAYAGRIPKRTPLDSVGGLS